MGDDLPGGNSALALLGVNPALTSLAGIGD